MVRTMGSTSVDMYEVESGTDDPFILAARLAESRRQFGIPGEQKVLQVDPKLIP